MEDEQFPFQVFSGPNIDFNPQEPFPIKGYQEPENFPYESVFHKTAIEYAEEWFVTFPDCCEPHKELAKSGRIERSTYEGLPMKILRSLSYTEYFILKYIDTEDWYGKITDYMDYVWLCFGQPNIGADRYCRYIRHFVDGTIDKIPEDKRKTLIEHIDSYGKPADPNEESKFDVTVLYTTLQKWVKTFPFELPYFKGLKEQFEGKIPAFKEPGRYNPYTRMTKAKALSKQELIEALEVLTKRLLSEVQTDKLLAEGQISDLAKHRLDLSNESLRVGTSKLVNSYTKGEQKYVTTVKKWLDLQKTYFKEVAEIMKSAPHASPKAVTHLPAFSNLFVNEAAAHRAFNAAVHAGIINEAGRKQLGERRISAAIIQYWEAVSDPKFELTHLRAVKEDVVGTYLQQCQAIALQFGTTIGKSAVYDHSGKRAGKIFTTVSRALSGT